MSQQYEYKGVIHQIGKTETYPSGFRKRTLVVCEDPSAKWVNYAAFDFFKDKTELLDRCKVGQKVTVSFYVSANESKKKPGSWFSGNNGAKIEIDGGIADLLPADSPARENTEPAKEAIDDDLPF